MRINVEIALTDNTFALDDLTDDMALADLLALLQLETDVPPEQMLLHVDFARVNIAESKTKTLAAAGVRNGSSISVLDEHIAEARITPRNLALVKEFRDSLRADPYQFAILKHNNPPLADALMSPDIARTAFYFVLNVNATRRDDFEKRRQQAALAADPFNIEAQRALERQIAADNIEQQRQTALEHMPESFGSVVMLYVNVVINGHPVCAFVDSGAQVSIMSAQCAERCSLMRLVDTRFEGVARGVGTQKIVGRIHVVDMEIAGAHLPTSFQVLQDQHMDVLIGLDMLRRHQCIIDLRSEVLVIGTTGKSAPFLGEKDLPAFARPGHEDTPASSGGAGPAAAALPTVNEASVGRLTAMGFSRAQAIEALAVCGDDVDRAASYLVSSV